MRNYVVCVVARLVFVFYCALTTGRCNAFQHIFGNKKKSEFYGPYFQTMLFLVTMVTANLLRTVYFAIFDSYLRYGCQVWGQNKTAGTNEISPRQSSQGNIF